MLRAHRAAEILACLRVAQVPAVCAPALHASVLEAQAQIEDTAPVPPIGPGDAGVLIAQGTPLLLADAYLATLVEHASYRRMAERVAALLGAHRPALTASPETERSGLEPAMAAFVAHHAGTAFLRPVAAELAPVIDEEPWGRAACPVCGSAPDLAAIGGQGRRLLCSRCDAEWSYRRLGCPFCEELEPRAWRYYPAGDGRYRLYVCESCGRYLKAVDVTRGAEETCLPLQRLLTVGLDAAALTLEPTGAVAHPARA